MAVLKAKAWNPGRTLAVAFLDGDPWVQDKVMDIAREWSVHAHVQFQKAGSGEGDIRVSFEDEGYWSAIGMEVTEYKRKEATLNLQGFSRDTDETEFRRVVLHEFGHALGCIHEHSSPDAGIPWDREAVYRYYEGPPNHWSRADVDFNLFQRYEARATQFSAFDPESIMLYPIPPEHTAGRYSVGWNDDLSATDRAFIGLLYPRFPSAIVDTAAGGTSAPGHVRVPGEQNHFRFRVVDPGAYVVETSGYIDTVLTVFGPDTFGRTVGHDDDSGLGQNAKLEAYLERGEYFARVVHKDPGGTGTFTLAVRRAGGPSRGD